ncbi:uncharacterized protein LOC118424432 [Branchiostoma floridae]|uniref:Uncharacterized protein LOC118424432 n=1 Tax=Branchiostoma floridae TaxID=7739 RepID=A0A9J7N3P4_BRAFL|nr:uncharacterized protein LOC118424432 [Branchiostoma floridae]
MVAEIDSTVAKANSTITQKNSTVTQKNSTVTQKNSTVTQTNSVCGDKFDGRGENSGTEGPSSERFWYQRREMPRRLRLTIYPRKGGKGKVKTKAKVQGAPASDEAEWHTDEEDAMFQDLEYTARSPLCQGEKRCRSVSSTPRRILKWGKHRPYEKGSRKTYSKPQSTSTFEDEWQTDEEEDTTFEENSASPFAAKGRVKLPRSTPKRSSRAKRGFKHSQVSPNPQGSVRKRIRFGTPKKSDAWNTAMCEGMTKTKDEYTQVSAGDFLDLDQDDSSRIDKTVQEMIDLLPRVLVELRDLDSSKQDILLRFCHLVEAASMSVCNPVCLLLCLSASPSESLSDCYLSVGRKAGDCKSPLFLVGSQGFDLPRCK